MKTRLDLCTVGVLLVASIALLLSDPATMAAPNDAANERTQSAPRPFPGQPAAVPQPVQRSVKSHASSAKPSMASRIGQLFRRKKTVEKKPHIFQPNGQQRPINRSSNYRLNSQLRPEPTAPRGPSISNTGIRRTTNNQQPESELQRQLRLLYQKNGKRMPNMSPSSLPTSTPASRGVGPGGRGLQRRTPPTTHSPNAVRNSHPKKSSTPNLLKRIFPFARSSRTRKSDPRPTRSGARGMRKYQPTPFPLSQQAQELKDRRNSAIRNNSNTQPVPPQPVRYPSGRINVQPVTRPRALPITGQSGTVQPAPFGQIPATAKPTTRPFNVGQQTTPRVGQPTRPNTNSAAPSTGAEIPLLFGQKKNTNKVVPVTQPATVKKNSNSKLPLLSGGAKSSAADPNKSVVNTKKKNILFPEGSEDEADGIKRAKKSPGLKIVIDHPNKQHPLTVKKPVVKTTPAANQFPNGSKQSADQGLKKDNPFSGLQITNDPPKVQKSVVKKSGAVEKSETPGFKIRPSGTPKVVRKIPRPTTNSKPTTANKPQKAAVAKKKNPHADKLRRIAARKDQKGLKGFCPVVLRDQRDLADVDPKFQSTYNGKRYFFSSSAAKATFENSPQKYAPVNGGQDIVALAAGSKTVDGYLDHAAWFKDRLYLFANQKTLKRFVREPKKFAAVIKK